MGSPNLLRASPSEICSSSTPYLCRRVFFSTGCCCSSVGGSGFGPGTFRNPFTEAQQYFASGTTEADKTGFFADPEFPEGQNLGAPTGMSDQEF